MLWLYHESLLRVVFIFRVFFFFQAEDGIRDGRVTGVQTCALPIFAWTEDPADDLARDLAARKGKALAAVDGAARKLRSEERRVGKECRSRGSRYHEKKKSSKRETIQGSFSSREMR